MNVFAQDILLFFFLKKAVENLSGKPKEGQNFIEDGTIKIKELLIFFGVRYEKF